MSRALWALPAASFAMGTQAYVFVGLLADLARDLGVGVGAAGQLSTAFALALALAAPAAAALAGRWERRRVLVLALLATAALNGLAAAAPGFGALLGLRVAAALAAAFVTPIASAAALALAPPEARGRALARVSGGLTLAFVLGIPAGSVVGGLLSWRATFGFAALLALAAAAVLRLALPPVPAPAARPALGGALRRPGVARALALSFLGFAATFTVVAYLGPVVNAATGHAGAAVGAFQLCVGLGSLIGLALGGRLADGPRARPAAPVAYAAMAATLAAYTPLLRAGPPPAGAGAAAALLLGAVILLGAAALFALMPLLQARLAAAAGPAATPVLLGLNATMVFLGQGAGAALGGLVTDGLGFPAIGLAGAAVAALALGVAAQGLGRGRGDPASAAPALAGERAP